MSDPTISDYTLVYIPIQNARFKSGFPFGTNITRSLQGLYNTPIPGLNASVNQVLKDPKYHDVRVKSININFSSDHRFDCCRGSNGELTVTDNRSIVRFTGTFRTVVAVAGGLHNIRFDGTIAGGNSSFEGMQQGNKIQVSTSGGNPIPTLSNYTLKLGSVCGLCDANWYYNTTIRFTLVIQVGICNTQSISNPTCVSYCNSTAGIEPCFNDYVSYCLTPVGGGGASSIRIGTDTTCQGYFASYINNVNPSPIIDEALGKYCAAKFRGFGDLESSASASDRALCGCNMPQSQYTAYINNLLAAFPEAKLTSVNERCFYFPCASSKFKNQSTGKVCPVPDCLNIVGVTNNGTFDNSTIKVEQSTTCQKLLGEPAPGTATDPNNQRDPTGTVPPQGSPLGDDDDDDDDDDDGETFWEKYRLWFIIGGVVLILIIIIVIIVIATRKKGDNKKSDKNKQTAMLLAAM